MALAIDFTIFKKGILLFGCLLFLLQGLTAQSADCPYPVILLHGWTGDQSSFSDTYTDPAFEAVFGTLTDNHVFHAMLNASTSSHIWGNDGIPGTADDDALVTFNNETNDLAPGCVYATNFDNSWNEDTNNPLIYHNSGDAISITESDSNESSIRKQGYALGKMIEKVLAANPTKDKVILIGHSMGGLAVREYLQRRTPENSTGTPAWWVNPATLDGHQVIRASTVVTPNLGSNTMGNISLKGNDEVEEKDGLPDLNSEAVRDLRYSWSCGWLGLSDCQGAYLYGGDEDAGWGWWNEDVDCDGSENNGAVVGINIAGGGDAWDGTYDNPAMPLPTNLHYTWMTSDMLGDDGDGVVAWSRQWLHAGNIPMPFNTTAGLLSDTIFTDVFHTSANDDANFIVRGMDEGDYPYFAWHLDLGTTYNNLPNYRAGNVPEGSPHQDPDWYMIDIPAAFSKDIQIDITAPPNSSAVVDFFNTYPGDFLSISASGDISTPVSSGATGIVIPNANLTAGSTHYFRIKHSNASSTDWQTPLQVTVHQTSALPLEWLSFKATQHTNRVRLDWEVLTDDEVAYFELEKSRFGTNFTTLHKVMAETTADLQQKSYVSWDETPEPAHNYYRVKAWKTDGSYEYSQVIHFYFTDRHLKLLELYPQPAKDVVALEWYAPKTLPLHWILYNGLGQPVLQGSWMLNSGNQQVFLPVTALESGVYYLTATGESFFEKKKILVK